MECQLANREAPDSSSQDNNAGVMRHETDSPQFVESAAELERNDILGAIREGLADVEKGNTKPARTVFKSLADKYGISLEQS